MAYSCDFFVGGEWIKLYYPGPGIPSNLDALEFTSPSTGKVVEIPPRHLATEVWVGNPDPDAPAPKGAPIVKVVNR